MSKILARGLDGGASWIVDGGGYGNLPESVPIKGGRELEGGRNLT